MEAKKLQKITRNDISDPRLDFQSFPYLNSEDNNAQNLKLQTKNRFVAFDSIDASFDAAVAVHMRVATISSPYASWMSVYSDYNANYYGTRHLGEIVRPVCHSSMVDRSVPRLLFFLALNGRSSYNLFDYLDCFSLDILLFAECISTNAFNSTSDGCYKICRDGGFSVFVQGSPFGIK